MEKQFYPYRELLQADIIYWLDTNLHKLLWKTQILQVTRYPYSNKRKLYDLYKNSMTEKYYNDRLDSGYFLYY